MRERKNRDAELLNPCLKEQELTYKCFAKNNYDKKACDIPIQNYNTCKEFWNFVRLDRKRRGIVPNIPPVEERNQVKQEYINKYNKSH